MGIKTANGDFESRPPQELIGITLLGGVSVEGPQGRFRLRGVQPGLVLACLVLERPRPLARDELVDLLWPESVPVHWAGAARHVVARARAVLVAAGVEETALSSSGGSVALTLGTPIEVDVEAVIGAVADAESAIADQLPDRAAKGARYAIELTRMPFIPGAEGSWVEQWRSRLAGLRRRAILAAANAALLSELPEDAVAFTTEALTADPFDESAARLLMSAHEAAGNRAAALAVYERLRRSLDDELGVRPTAETEGVFLRLLGSAPPGRRSAVTGRQLLTTSTKRRPFIGRERELATLDQAWSAARVGALAIAVLEGQPGIGKTRLAAEFASRVMNDGGSVVWGRCTPDATVTLQPFDELVREVAVRLPSIVEESPWRDDLTSLVPDLTGQVPVGTADPSQAMSRLFRAVTGLITAAAAELPLLVIIDDLQFAGTHSLDLLSYLGSSLSGAGCLVVLVLREPEGALANTLAGLERTNEVVTCRLAGLSIAEVSELLARSGRSGERAVAGLITERTAGNPLYVTQLIGEAEGTDAPLDPTAVPLAVAELLRRRIAALDRPVEAALTLAAVVGPVFDLTTLEACSTEPEALLDIAEELCRRSFLEERGPARFAFVHQIVRDAVLETVGPTRRQRLHQRVGDVLAEAGAEPALLAYHFCSAGPAGAQEAGRWLLLAGERALAQGAWADAAGLFNAALSQVIDIDDRCRGLVGLGKARRALGDAGSARSLLECALTLGRASNRGAASAAATLALVGGGGRGVALDMPDTERASLLREALDGIDSANPSLLVGVLGELALTLVLTPGTEAEQRALCDQCLDEARRWGDPDGLAAALATHRIALVGPARTRDRVAEATEVLTLPVSTVAPERRLAAHLALVEDWLELGDRRAADAALTDAARLAEYLQHPYWTWSTRSWQSLSATIDGRIDDAASLSSEALSCNAEHPEAIAAFGVQLVNQRLFDGRAGEVLDLLRSASDENPNIPCYRAVLALCGAEGGDLVESRAAFEVLARSGFDLPADSNWLLAVTVLADACATLGDVDRAPVLTELLEPWSDRQVVLNCYGGGGAWWGPVTHHLGRLAALRGDRSTAQRLLGCAIEQSEAFRAPRFAARSRAELARVSSDH